MPSGKFVHDEYRRRLNRANSDYSSDISVRQVDSYLNEALEIWFENRVDLSELNSTVRNDLRQFEIKNKEINRVDVNTIFNVYEYPDNFYKLLRQWAVVSKKGCPEKNIVVLIWESDDISEGLRDPNWKPSYEYEETIADEGEKGLYIWHNGEFTIKKVYVDYYRKPNRIAVPSLIKPDGKYTLGDVSVTEDSDLEVNSTYAYRKIIDIAVACTLRDIGDTNDFNSIVQKILFANSVEKQ